MIEQDRNGRLINNSGYHQKSFLDDGTISFLQDRICELEKEDSNNIVISYVNEGNYILEDGKGAPINIGKEENDILLLKIKSFHFKGKYGHLCVNFLDNVQRWILRRNYQLNGVSRNYSKSFSHSHVKKLNVTVLEETAYEFEQKVLLVTEEVNGLSVNNKRSHFPHEVRHEIGGCYSLYDKKENRLVLTFTQDIKKYLSLFDRMRGFYFSGEEGALVIYKIIRMSGATSWYVRKHYYINGLKKSINRSFPKLGNGDFDLNWNTLERFAKYALGKSEMIKKDLQQGNPPLWMENEDLRQEQNEDILYVNNNLEVVTMETLINNNDEDTLNDDRDIVITILCFQPWTTPPSCAKYDQPTIRTNNMRQNIVHGYVEIDNKHIDLIHGDYIAYKNSVPIRVFSADALQMIFGDM